MPTSFDRSVAPSGGVIRPFRLPAVESAKLGNGLQVLSMHRGEVPLVSVCLVLAAGEAGVPMEQGGLAVLTGDTLQGGTEQRSGVELAEALERLGTGLRVSTTWDATTLAFTCVAERLDGVMALLAEVACSCGRRVGSTGVRVHAPIPPTSGRRRALGEPPQSGSSRRVRGWLFA
jgi:hypothetical protein